MSFREKGIANSRSRCYIDEACLSNVAPRRLWHCGKRPAALGGWGSERCATDRTPGVSDSTAIAKLGSHIGKGGEYVQLERSRRKNPRRVKG
jgi:hypothetical protein